MSETKFISEVHKISHTSSSVFNCLSNFNMLGLLYDKLSNISDQEIDMMIQASGVVDDRSKEQFGKIKEGLSQIEHFEANTDSCAFTVKGYDAGLRIIERESNKTIKIIGEGKLPVDFVLWIQLINKGPYDTRIRLTLHADMNMMMKMMLKKKIEKGIDQFAEGLTKIPYSSLDNFNFSSSEDSGSNNTFKIG